MKVCNYCGRYLKGKYDNCPACGSKDFKTLQNYDEIRIDTPPKDGYHLNLKNYYFQKKQSNYAIMVGLYFIIICIGVPILMTPHMLQLDDSDSIFDTVYNIVFVGTIGVAMTMMIIQTQGFKILKSSKEEKKKIKDNIKNIEFLAKNGVLIKNLKYTLKPVKGSINGRKTVYTIQVIYELEKGKTKCFNSEPKYLSALGRDDGTVDLLLDLNNTSNYFIDFEIY